MRYFLYLGIVNRRVLLILSLLIPVALSITLLAFYILGLSINIVSLAGLVLGIGEIIDSAIIIIENIEQQRERVQSVWQACITGTQEVVWPLFTSVLTNSAVFLPLLFLSGIAGALFFDQAVSVTLALGISLLASYTLVPVLYHRLYRNQTTYLPANTPLMRAANQLYLRIFNAAFRYRRSLMMACAGLLVVALWVCMAIPKSGMPHLSRTELQWTIDWNEPISPAENQRRLGALLDSVRPHTQWVNAYIGGQQFLLNSRLNQAPSEAVTILKVYTTANYQAVVEHLQQLTARQYPQATSRFLPALNVFEQLFQTDEAELMVRLYAPNSQQSPAHEQVQQATHLLQKAGFDLALPPSRNRIQLVLSEEKLALYQVSPQAVYDRLSSTFGQYKLNALKAQPQQWPMVIGNQVAADPDSVLAATFIDTPQGYALPLRALVSYRFTEDFASRYLSKEGAYIALELHLDDTQRGSQSYDLARKALAKGTGFSFDFAGSYFRNQGYLLELAWVILIAVAMLFFILAAQFESLLQPFIVLLTFVFGTTGALCLLYLSGETLNIMSSIGIVVLIGLLDNDSILKIDTMNRSRGQLSLIERIREAGQRRLPSQLMTYFTTVLGLLPILWAAGLGAELQKPLALTVLGGMTLGVLYPGLLFPSCTGCYTKTSCKPNKKERGYTAGKQDYSSSSN